MAMLPQVVPSDSWFCGLPNCAQRAFMDAGRLWRLGAGERVFSRGEPPTGLYHVISGRIRIAGVTSDGREALLTFLEPSNWFGEVSCVDNDPRTHDADAEVTSVLLHVAGAD